VWWHATCYVKARQAWVTYNNNNNNDHHTLLATVPLRKLQGCYGHHLNTAFAVASMLHHPNQWITQQMLGKVARQVRRFTNADLVLLTTEASDEARFAGWSQCLTTAPLSLSLLAPYTQVLLLELDTLPLRPFAHWFGDSDMEENGVVLANPVQQNKNASKKTANFTVAWAGQASSLPYFMRFDQHWPWWLWSIHTPECLWWWWA
jgi:hypothetical protein